MTKPETSVLVLQKQLDAANKEIATLRTVVDHTVAIVAGAGGRVEVPVAKYEEYSQRRWRHENDGITHIFTTEAE
jgi:hypothetical protein